MKTENRTHVVRLAASESNYGRARYIRPQGDDGRPEPSGPGVDVVTEAAHMDHASAVRLAASMAHVSGGYGWSTVRADVAAAGYEIEGRGTCEGYNLLLGGHVLPGVHGTRAEAWAAAEAHFDSAQETKTTKIEITGREAIKIHRETGAELLRHDDPIFHGGSTAYKKAMAEGRAWVSVEEAEELIRQDPVLVYVLVEAPAETPVIEAVDVGRLRALRDEAGAAGDLAQVAVCDRALAGDEAALRECACVIREGQG